MALDSASDAQNSAPQGSSRSLTLQEEGRPAVTFPSSNLTPRQIAPGVLAIGIDTESGFRPIVHFSADLIDWIPVRLAPEPARTTNDAVEHITLPLGCTLFTSKRGAVTTSSSTSDVVRALSPETVLSRQQFDPTPTYDGVAKPSYIGILSDQARAEAEKEFTSDDLRTALREFWQGFNRRPQQVPEAASDSHTVGDHLDSLDERVDALERPVVLAHYEPSFDQNLQETGRPPVRVEKEYSLHEAIEGLHNELGALNSVQSYNYVENRDRIASLESTRNVDEGIVSDAIHRISELKTTVEDVRKSQSRRVDLLIDGILTPFQRRIHNLESFGIEQLPALVNHLHTLAQKVSELDSKVNRLLAEDK